MARKHQKKRDLILLKYKERFGIDSTYNHLIEKYYSGELENDINYSDLAAKVIKINEKKSLKSQVIKFNLHEISVVSEGKQTIVTIQENESLKCSCRYIENFILPCSHLIVASTLLNKDYRFLISDHYSIKNYFLTYLEEIKLLDFDKKVEIEEKSYPSDWAAINLGRRPSKRKKINRKKLRSYKLTK